MEDMNHFSHKDHPLKLIENWEMTIGVGGDGEKEVIRCYGCGEPILGGSAYGCIPCHYFLHKVCAELTPTINHYLHFKHPLILAIPYKSMFGGPTCNVCKRDQVGKITYHCSLCYFDACIKCASVALALQEARDIKLEHEGHPQHTLTLQFRRASFLCDACDVNDEDLFYQCNNCTFWIHKTCATLSSKIDLPHHHHHPLLLAYSLPDNFYNFFFNCEFCKKMIYRSYWVYHCANCRYFAHIKCALKAMQLSNSSDDPSTSNAEEQMNDDDFLHFPMLEAFNDPLKQLHSKNIDLDDDGAIEIVHWSHDHPLIINNVEPQGTNMLEIGCNDPIKVCYGCVRSLSFPYYSCKDGCSFTLHKYCANLPHTLEHQLHPDHLLNLVDFKDSEKFTYTCSGCFTEGNTFVYNCETCEFYLDVNCAFLPNTIKHERHKHPLVSLVQGIDPISSCKACGNWSMGINYFCKTCDFQLDMLCAMNSPHSIAHRHCKGHPVPLVYPPVEDHCEDFYCDICEEEMHPKMWMYYCHKCDSTFHLHCIGRVDQFLNISVEGATSVPYHKHPLTFVRRNKTPRYVCFGCNCDINGRLILECRTGTCPFRVCAECFEKNLN